MTILLLMFESSSAVIALLTHYSYWTTAFNHRYIAPNEHFDRWRSKCTLQKSGHSYHKIFVTNIISEYKKCNMLMSFAFCGLYVRHTTQEIFIMQMLLFKKILWTRIHPHIDKSNKHTNNIDNHSKINTVETLYSTIYYSKYFIELNIDKSTLYAALWTHKRHPIPRPFGRAMECLLWVLQQKLIVL